MVTLDLSDTFEILITSNEINATGNQQSVLVPSEDAKTVNFPIKPKQLGEIPIKVAAISPTASDAILQKVLVKVNIQRRRSCQAFRDGIPLNRRML